MNTAIYLRKSRAEERNDTVEETLRVHKKILLDYAKKQQLSILQIYEEVISGESLFARPQMLQLLQDVEEGRYDAVLCMDIDRLGRGGMKDQGIILDTFKDARTLIITPDKTYDLNDETDEELTEFKTFISRRELKIINKRLRRGMLNSIKEGGYLSNPPYGYRRAYKGKTPSLEIVEEEARFVRLIFDMYLEGYGSTIIADTVNSMGAKPRRSDRFGRTSIVKILRDIAYTGMVRWNQKKCLKKGVKGNKVFKTIENPESEWITVPGKHDPIIEQEKFDTAQQILKTRAVSPKKTRELSNPMAGLVYCQQCGSLMQQGISKGIPYYHCPKKGCSAGAKMAYVEEALMDGLQRELEHIAYQCQDINTPAITAARESLIAVESELKKAERQREKLFDLFESDVYDLPTFQARMAALTEKTAHLHQAQESLNSDLHRLSGAENQRRMERIRNAIELYHSATIAGKNLILKGVIAQVFYSKPKKTKPKDFTLKIVVK